MAPDLPARGCRLRHRPPQCGQSNRAIGCWVPPGGRCKSLRRAEHRGVMLMQLPQSDLAPRQTPGFTAWYLTTEIAHLRGLTPCPVLLFGFDTALQRLTRSFGECQSSLAQ